MEITFSFNHFLMRSVCCVIFLGYSGLVHGRNFKEKKKPKPRKILSEWLSNDICNWVYGWVMAYAITCIYFKNLIFTGLLQMGTYVYSFISKAGKLAAWCSAMIVILLKTTLQNAPLVQLTFVDFGGKLTFMYFL